MFWGTLKYICIFLFEWHVEISSNWFMCFASLSDNVWSTQHPCNLNIFVYLCFLQINLTWPVGEVIMRVMVEVWLRCKIYTPIINCWELGVLETLSCLCTSLTTQLLPFLVLLVLPVLGRMSDPCTQVGNYLRPKLLNDLTQKITGNILIFHLKFATLVSLTG